MVWVEIFRFAFFYVFRGRVESPPLSPHILVIQNSSQTAGGQFQIQADLAAADRITKCNHALLRVRRSACAA